MNKLITIAALLATVYSSSDSGEDLGTMLEAECQVDAVVKCWDEEKEQFCGVLYYEIEKYSASLNLKYTMKPVDVDDISLGYVTTVIDYNKGTKNSVIQRFDELEY